MNQKQVEPVRKITMKGLGAVPKPDQYEIGQTLPVATVYGRADSYKVDESNFGEYKKFKGRFEAVNAFNGDVQVSSALIMPDIFGDMLAESLNKHEGEEGIKFAVIVAVKGVEKRDGSKGYEWSIQTVQAPEQNDELSELRALTVDAVKALPAPSKAATKTAGKK